MRETRAHVIWHHVQQCLRHTGTAQDDFAPEVAALYEKRTPLHARGVHFHGYAAGDNPYDVNRSNAQLLFRMLKPDGPSRLPVELEEAVVLALPQPFQNECLGELAARLGQLSAAMPAGADAPLTRQIHSPCELLRRAANAVERIAPMLEDNNSIGPEDAAHFPEALAAVNEVIGVCVTVNAQVAQAMQQMQAGKGGTVTRMRKAVGQ